MGTSAIAIKVALANIGDKVNADEIFNYIESNSYDIETYQLDSSKVAAAAVDFMIILNAIGSVASLAALFWMAYDKYIAPKKHGIDNSGIYIVVYLSEKDRIEFWIGNTHLDKDKFIHEFTKRVTKFSGSKMAKQVLNEVMRDVTHSDVWKKRK